MRQLITSAVLSAVVCAFAVPTALAAADPVGIVKNDVVTLQADVQTKHTLVIADAQKVTADATARAGAKHSQVKLTLRPDLQKLQNDTLVARTTITADRQRLQRDLQAVRSAKLGKGQLASLVKQARAADNAANAEVKAELKIANQAVSKLLHATLKP
jgi:hypothetical protein